MGELKSKRDMASSLLRQLEGRLRCPYCQETLVVVGMYKLVCVEAHSFDLSKQGTLYTLTQSGSSQYDIPLFQARRSIIQQKQLYAPMHERLVQELDEGNLLLDAGTGEGSHLNEIKRRFPTILPVGLDISKDGIQQAAKAYQNHVWIVGDLANVPFCNQTVDIILNILSPSNYGEFKRVLTSGGKLIKVVPGTRYLQELRAYTAEASEQQYSNAKTIDLFNHHFKNTKLHTLSYQKEVTSEERQWIAEMSPLGWTVQKEARCDYINNGCSFITIDLTILIARA